jgi:hypothetical protein
VVFIALSFSLAWIERAAFVNAKIPPLLTYIGAAFLVVGQFYALRLSSQAWEVWPAYTAGLCALFVLLAWLLRRPPVQGVYGVPLHWVGACLMILPLAGATYLTQPFLAAATYAIAGITYATDAVFRRNLRLGYLAGGAFIVGFWYLLRFYNIEELQVYAMPLGLGLLVIGWLERRRGGRLFYLLPTLLGLIILMGSAFYQSFEAVIYAVLLLVESLAAIACGIRFHSRVFVQLGVLALIVNAVAQLGPAYVELPRWIQLGSIGAILLGGGLVALFRREKLLAARKRLTDEWRLWEV